MNEKKVNIIIPAKNEYDNLKKLLPKLTALYPNYEITIVDDGSTDNTALLCKENNINCISHPYNKGNGAAIKTGISSATGDILVFMDADGQHDPQDVDKLISLLDKNYHMVIAARSSKCQSSIFRKIGNFLYCKFASWMVEHKIKDLTSGFRAVYREKALEFLHIIPNGFSYPTTLTMSFYRRGYSVAFYSTKFHKRDGKSHIRLLKDGTKFFLIIFKISTLYSPLKIFFPASFIIFLSAVSYMIYTLLLFGRFTNMSVLLYISSVFIFLMGLISEQITTLMYQKK